MRNRIILGLVGAVMLTAGEAGAAGLGASVQNNTGTIYIPIQLTGALIEPFFRFRYIDDDEDFEQRFYDLGVGLFLQSPIADKVSAYYGGRIFGTRNDVEGSFDGDESSYGFGIAPTLGAEYMVSNSVGVGVEASLDYVSVSGDVDFTTVTTNSEVLLRLYF